jgi:ABC-type multidrug transport system fused ATPase/permease subunit
VHKADSKADCSLMRAQCCRRVVEALEVVAASALEMLSSMRLIRTFTKESAEKARFGSQVLGAYKVAKHMAVANGIADGVGVLVVKVSVLGVVCQPASCGMLAAFLPMCGAVW